MNLSTPILICDENEEIRLLLKEMLIKHGYFHLLEAHTREEVLQLYTGEQFLLVHKKILSEEIKRLFSKTSRFLIVAQNDEQETVNLSAAYGVKHFVSFPYSSRSLVEKIDSLMA